jgi:hypothetical protein
VDQPTNQTPGKWGWLGAGLALYKVIAKLWGQWCWRAAAEQRVRAEMADMNSRYERESARVNAKCEALEKNEAKMARRIARLRRTNRRQQKQINHLKGERDALLRRVDELEKTVQPGAPESKS